MLDSILDARERLAVGVGGAVLLWLVGLLLGALVRRRYLRLGRPSFAHVIGRVLSLAFALLGVLMAITVVFPTIKPVNTLGSLGFFSIAVGFAFRDILENLLAGILLLFRAPFRTHDEVDIGGVRGAVVAINLRETVLRTYDGRQVLIPNSTVYKNPITVQTGYPAVRDEASFGVAHGTDLDQARAVALDVLHRDPAVLEDPPPSVLVEEVGSRRVDLRLLFWTAPGQAQVRRARDTVLRSVVTAYASAGIDLPADVMQVEAGSSLADALRQDRTV